MCHIAIDDYCMRKILLPDRRLIALRLPVAMHTIADLRKLAQETGANVIWIMPDTNASLSLEEIDGYKLTISYDDSERNRMPRWALIKHAGKEVQVGWSHHFGWKVEKPLDILASVDYVETAVGTHLEWSPVHYGRTIFRQKYHANNTLRAKIAESEIDLLELPFMESACAIQWKHAEIGMCARSGYFWHHVDRRSSYPTSAKSVYVGLGTPIHVGPEHNRKSTTEIGIYRIKWNINMSDFDGKCLPLIVSEGREWVTHDLLNMLDSRGYEWELQEAWIYERSCQLLRSWADKMFDYRKDLRDEKKYVYQRARENAENTIKLASNGFLGSLGSDKFKQFRRPDWYVSVIGKARTTVLGALHKFRRFNPVLVCADDIWFASREPDIEKALCDVFVRRDEPGGFRPKGTVTMDDDVMENLRSSMSVVEMHTYLKGIEK